MYIPFDRSVFMFPMLRCVYSMCASFSVFPLLFDTHLKYVTRKIQFAPEVQAVKFRLFDTRTYIFFSPFHPRYEYIYIKEENGNQMRIHLSQSYILKSLRDGWMSRQRNNGKQRRTGVRFVCAGGAESGRRATHGHTHTDTGRGGSIIDWMKRFTELRWRRRPEDKESPGWDEMKNKKRRFHENVGFNPFQCFINHKCC